ncbi:protein kinase containing Z-DNA binding domains [Rhinichthys klamathensis goyatoka]|uniref:protein kinase containing Z-DNA binding domains n=1 Tax=Rhinichthys klamathensis goyatoka TaxID=3034132 RepID=UPI0024B4C99C|nr:protein kinase containing Z-DNA binding domains [Rhinichthys klamathensis goyatoka]
MSADFEMEKKIVDFLRQNGKSTVLIIFKKFGLNRSTANRHLYNLERSQQVFKSNKTPPVWDLMEKKIEIKHTLKPEQKSQTTTRDSCGEIQEERVRDLLKSGGLKAHQIAKSLKQPPKNTKKQLYIMEKEGKVQKCIKTNIWTLNDEESNDSYNLESSCSSDHRLGSNSGLSKSFDVIIELGKGGFGCVYKVKHKFDGKIYAVKEVVLTGKADSEVKALARLDHPNIVRYITCWSDSENCTSNQERNKASNTSRSSSDVVTFDRSGCEENDDDDDDDDDDDVIDDVTSGMASLGVTADTRTYLFIQMEFCEGGTLTAWINDRNYKEIKRTTMDIHQIFYEIISGVEYIHSNNLIHRDLKPDNILFGSDGQVKIGDFGLVVHQTNDSGDPIERSNKGTPPYMSPEQKNGKNYGEKTDIFPLGLVWFEMLWKISTGRERAKLWPDLRNQRFPEGFCDCYPTENKFIKEMLSFTPEDRPQAQHIKEKLELFFSLDQNLLSQKTI